MGMAALAEVIFSILPLIHSALSVYDGLLLKPGTLTTLLPGILAIRYRISRASRFSQTHNHAGIARVLRPGS